MAEVFKGHNIADIAGLAGVPDAVTIGVESNSPLTGDDALWSNDIVVNHEIILSIRAHTGWMLGPHYQETTVELMDDIIEKLKTNVTLSNGYRIMGFSTTFYREEFIESGTRGGQVNVALHKVTQYTQE